MVVPDSTRHTYTFGKFTLDAQRSVLLKGGAQVKLRPQSFDVLKYLVTRHGCVVTKDELLKEIWRGKIVTDDSITHCLHDIRKALGDKDKKAIRTVPRRGYIFEAPLGTNEASKPALQPKQKKAKLRQSIMAASVIASAIVILWLFDIGSMRSDALMPENSVAVLPFADLSETQDQQYLGDGLSSEILNLLSRSSDLIVIARTSSFSLAKSSPDIRVIRESLNVAYVVEGTIRRSGDRLNVTVQLIDTKNESNVWSERFERHAKELLAVQAQIAEAVLVQIAPQSDPGVVAPAARNFSANELMYLASYYENTVREKPIVDEPQLHKSIRLYRDAVEADPTSALAHSRLAGALLYGGYVKEAEAPVLKALQLDANLSEVQETVGKYNWAVGRPGAGAAWKRAIELNPNNPEALSSYAYWYWLQGKDEGPEEWFRRALELDPLSLARHAALGEFLANQGRVKPTQKLIDLISKKFSTPDSFRVIARLLELTGKLDQSIAWTIKARDAEPGNENHIAALAELYAEVGDFETALALEPIPSVGLLYKMRRYDEFIDEAEYVMIEQPDDIYLRHLLAFAYNVNGHYDRAIRILETIGQPESVRPETRQAIDIEAFVTYFDALNQIGEVHQAQSLADWYENRSHVSSANWWVHVYRACSLAVLQRHNLALARLERIKDSPRIPWATVLQDSPCFQQYADEPRYQDILRQVEKRREAARQRVPETLAAHGVVL